MTDAQLRSSLRRLLPGNRERPMIERVLAERASQRKGLRKFRLIVGGLSLAAATIVALGIWSS